MIDIYTSPRIKEYKTTGNFFPIVQDEKYKLNNEEKKFKFNGEDYIIILPPKTGSRSFQKFFLKKNILSVKRNPDVSIDDVTVQHDTLDLNFSGKIIVTARDPLNRVISLYLMLRGYIDKNISETSIETFFRVEHDKTVGTFKGKSGIIDFHLWGKHPHYVINTDTQEQDILKLPFIDNLDGYERITGYETEKLQMISKQKEFVRNYIISNRNLAEKINNQYGSDFDYFGYEKI